MNIQDLKAKIEYNEDEIGHWSDLVAAIQRFQNALGSRSEKHHAYSNEVESLVQNATKEIQLLETQNDKVRGWIMDELALTD